MDSTSSHHANSPIRLAAILISIVLIILISAKLQVIIVPIVFSVIFSVMLYPLACKLESWGLNKALAALLSVFIANVVIGVLIYFLASQISSLNDQAPQLVEKFNVLIKKIQGH